MTSKKSLTKKQEEIVNKKGLFVVKARPGSGKTFAVAARFAKLLKDWKHSHRGIVAISFTNTAWQEIEKYLREDFGIKTPISYPHFLGTIDSFFNKYAFLPFGHLAMGGSNRPELTGPPFNNWEPIGNGWYWPKQGAECYKSQCKLNDFTYDINDALINISPRGHFKNCTQPIKHCDKYKRIFNSKGYATQADSRYFSMQLLRKFPQITKALVFRFPALIMDEAQDTSDVEMKAIDTMVENGLQEAMLIGDSEQAIFEWRNARPDLFESKYKEWENNSLTLDENWRSSQNVCNFFNKISCFSTVPKAVNEDVRDYDFFPAIWEYKVDDFQKLISAFLDLCKKHNISESKEVTIISRSKSLIKNIQGMPETTIHTQPWQNDSTANICESKFLYDKGKFKDALHCLEKSICKKIKNLDFCSSANLEEIISEYGFTKWRKTLYEILASIPNTNCTLGEWVEKANICFNNGSVIKNGDLSIKGGKYGKAYAAMSIRSLFASDLESASEDFRCGTIHSVKGETLEAVLTIFKKKAGDNKKYENVLIDTTLNSEELRIIYVAITRPRKVLVIAVPKGETSVWKKKFEVS